MVFTYAIVVHLLRAAARTAESVFIYLAMHLGRGGKATTFLIFLRIEGYVELLHTLDDKIIRFSNCDLIRFPGSFDKWVRSGGR